VNYAIETNELTKTFGSLRAVNSVSLRVGQGEIYGFLGLNGAGKTTTIRALPGMIRPSGGSVKVLGQVIKSGGRGPWQQYCSNHNISRRNYCNFILVAIC
jgi:ABC-2 type transport system ATP-binding protein